eukprot:scaffold61224_cov36-Tisochrysis_lutea.AAC.1
MVVVSLTPATPAALALVGAIELLGGLVDIIAPRRVIANLSPAETAVLPLIGGLPLHVRPPPSFSPAPRPSRARLNRRCSVQSTGARRPLRHNHPVYPV